MRIEGDEDDEDDDENDEDDESPQDGNSPGKEVRALHITRHIQLALERNFVRKQSSY